MRYITTTIIHDLCLKLCRYEWIRDGSRMGGIMLKDTHLPGITTEIPRGISFFKFVIIRDSIKILLG